MYFVPYLYIIIDYIRIYYLCGTHVKWGCSYLFNKFVITLVGSNFCADYKFYINKLESKADKFM